MRSKVESEKTGLQTELASTRKELEIARREMKVIQKLNEDYQQRLNLVDG